MKETREKIRRTFIIVKEEKRRGKLKLGARQNRKDGLCLKRCDSS